MAKNPSKKDEREKNPLPTESEKIIPPIEAEPKEITPVDAEIKDNIINEPPAVDEVKEKTEEDNPPVVDSVIEPAVKSPEELLKELESLNEELKAPSVDDSALLGNENEPPVVAFPEAALGKVSVRFIETLDRSYIVNEYVSGTKGETKQVTQEQANILKAKKYIV